MSNKITPKVSLEPNETAYHGILHISDIQHEDGSPGKVRKTLEIAFKTPAEIANSDITMTSDPWADLAFDVTSTQAPLMALTHKGRSTTAQRLPSSIIYSIYPHKSRIRLSTPHEPLVVLVRTCIHKYSKPQIDIPTTPPHPSQRLSRESTAYSTGHTPIASVGRYSTQSAIGPRTLTVDSALTNSQYSGYQPPISQSRREVTRAPLSPSPRTSSCSHATLMLRGCRPPCVLTTPWRSTTAERIIPIHDVPVLPGSEQRKSLNPASVRIGTVVARWERRVYLHVPDVKLPILCAPAMASCWREAGSARRARKRVFS